MENKHEKSVMGIDGVIDPLLMGTGSLELLHSTKFSTNATRTVERLLKSEIVITY